MKKIEFFKHNLTAKDIKLANRVMRSIFLTTGPMVDRFEKKLAGYLDMEDVVGLSSCTGALHLALLRYGIGPGDEVITTPLTFVATATAILEAGAKPVLADVCPRSGLLLPETAGQVITPRTKAIIPVHLYGRMADMRGFAALAKAHNLILIEDAAHCLGGLRDGIRPGQLGQAACFSFYATKSLTCGEGGALACHTREEGQWYRSARHHGISRNAASRYTKKYEHWDMEMMGWKYNMDDIQAALLLNQVERLEAYRRQRCALEACYRELLQEVDGLDFMQETALASSGRPGEKSEHHLFTVLLPKQVERDAVLAGLQAAGIGCAVNYRPLHVLSYFRETCGYRPEDFPVAYAIGERTISLPLYPKLTRHQIRQICTILKRLLKEVSKS
jgi:dTDP-4-amino-4,6-dideoxygalactose transaminase